MHPLSQQLVPNVLTRSAENPGMGKCVTNKDNAVML